MIILLALFRFFFENSLSNVCLNRGKFTAEVNDTDANICPKIYSDCSDTGGKFATGSNDAGRDTFHLI